MQVWFLASLSGLRIPCGGKLPHRSEMQLWFDPWPGNFHRCAAGAPLKRKKKKFLCLRSSLVAQWAGDSALSLLRLWLLLWLGFDPWPRNVRMQWAWPKKGKQIFLVWLFWHHGPKVFKPSVGGCLLETCRPGKVHAALVLLRQSFPGISRLMRLMPTFQIPVIEPRSGL